MRLKKENSRSYLNVVEGECDGSASLTHVFGIAFTTQDEWFAEDKEAGGCG